MRADLPDIPWTRYRVRWRLRHIVGGILWGAGVTLSAATVWGFLENADLIPHMPAFMWFPVFCGSMGLAQPIVRWRYR